MSQIIVFSSVNYVNADTAGVEISIHTIIGRMKKNQPASKAWARELFFTERHAANRLNFVFVYRNYPAEWWQEM